MSLPPLAVSVPDMWSIAGLILDAIGIVLLFWNAPEKFPDPQTRAFFKIEDGSRDEWERKQVFRRRIAGISVGMIVVGFVFQGIAVTFW